MNLNNLNKTKVFLEFNLLHVLVIDIIGISKKIRLNDRKLRPRNSIVPTLLELK